MEHLKIKTNKNREVVDITDIINEQLKDVEGETCLVFALHTTCALTTADLDPGTDLDMLDAFEALVPDINFRHPHNPDHAPDHILSSIIGASVVLPVENRELKLGTWQRVVLVEFDGPRERNLILSFK